jgi:hypothetical protein
LAWLARPNDPPRSRRTKRRRWLVTEHGDADLGDIVEAITSVKRAASSADLSAIRALVSATTAANCSSVNRPRVRAWCARFLSMPASARVGG